MSAPERPTWWESFVATGFPDGAAERLRASAKRAKEAHTREAMLAAAEAIDAVSAERRARGLA